VVFCSYHCKSRSVANQDKFFRALGTRVRGLRKKRGYSQEDMLSFGFSTRHWQQIEAGRPITVTTLLRICEVFEIPMAKLVHGLDADGVYDALDVEIPVRRRGGRKR
jgi:transcriptional regulator with XRE-family HTH domain